MLDDDYTPGRLPRCIVELGRLKCNQKGIGWVTKKCNPQGREA